MLTRRFLLVLLLTGFGLFILLRALELAFWVVMLVITAVILASALMPIVSTIQGLRIPPRGWRIPNVAAVLLTYIGGSLVFGLLAYSIGSQLVGELIGLFQRLPETLSSSLLNIESAARSLGFTGLLPSAEQLTSQLQALTGQAFDAVRIGLTAVGGLVGIIFRFFIVVTLAFFFVVESKSFLSFAVNLFPPSKRHRVHRLFSEIGDKIGHWVLGQVAVAAITGTLAGISAALLGLPYAILIGVVTALLDLAPAVGPALMAIPVFLLGLSHSLFLAIAGALVFTAISILDGNVLSPLITGRAVSLSPALIIVAATFGLALYGPLGALIAIPIAAAIQVVVTEVILPWMHEKEQNTTKESRN